MPSDEVLSFENRPLSSLSQLERLGSVTTGAALIAYGMSRRSVSGLMLAVAGLPLAYRGLAGHWPPGMESIPLPGISTGDTRRDLAGDRGIRVRESIRLAKPLAEVYQFWRRFENLPRFMANLERVTDLGDGRSHWIAKGPSGIRVEWDAEIINEVENKVIGWRTLPNADVAIAGSVAFESAPQDRGTQLTVHLQYAPPAGRLGALAAAVFGREPAQTIREDLRRLKQLLEAGEIPIAVPDDRRRR
jgi:uncharacterized membrane protein